jgi:HAD superfamily hydrolase (TIGR01549 family)
MMIKNIFWDFDGTLFDTYPPFIKALVLALKNLGHEVSYDETMALAKVSMDHCINTLAERFGFDPADIDEGFDEQYALITLDEQPPFPGVKEVLQKVVDIGGKNVIITHRSRDGMLALLERYHLKDYFTGWLNSDDGFPRKPDSSAFFAALQSYQVKASETLGMGDRKLDMDASRGAGLQTAFYGTPPDDVQADIVISDYAELLPKIG